MVIQLIGSKAGISNGLLIGTIVPCLMLRLASKFKWKQNFYTKIHNSKLTGPTIFYNLTQLGVLLKHLLEAFHLNTKRLSVFSKKKIEAGTIK